MKAFLCFVVFVLGSGITAKELPSYIPICKRNSPTLNECLKSAATTLQPYLAKGIRELSIPPLEPLQIPMVKLEQGTGAVNYKATISNIKLYGLSDYKFDEFRASFGKNVVIKGSTRLPKIRLVADYDISGRILLLPIQGNGEFTANITDCKADFTTMADYTKKKETEYLQSKDTRLQLEIGGAMVNFDNLFNGDPVLSKTTNAFFNNNAKDILNEVKPAIEAVAGMLIDDILIKVFKSAPYDKLFPKKEDKGQSKQEGNGEQTPQGPQVLSDPYKNLGGVKFVLKLCICAMRFLMSWTNMGRLG